MENFVHLNHPMGLAREFFWQVPSSVVVVGHFFTCDFSSRAKKKTSGL